MASGDFDKGYRDGKRGAPPSENSTSYREGYNDGRDDALFNAGYFDSMNEKEPQHPEEPMYMHGYEQGK